MSDLVIPSLAAVSGWITEHRCTARSRTDRRLDLLPQISTMLSISTQSARPVYAKMTLPRRSRQGATIFGLRSRSQKKDSVHHVALYQYLVHVDLIPPLTCHAILTPLPGVSRSHASRFGARASAEKTSERYVRLAFSLQLGKPLHLSPRKFETILD